MRYTMMATRQGIEQLTALVPFAGKDYNRPILTTVRFGPDDAAATDSYALGLAPIAHDVPTVGGAPLSWVGDRPSDEHAGRLLVDAKELKKALAQVKPGARSYAGEQVATVTFDTDEQTVTLEQGGTSITLRMVEGTFPKVDALVPDGRTLDNGGYVPSVSAELVGRFAALAHATTGQAKKSAESTGVNLIADQDGGLRPIVVETIDGARLGLLMPVKSHGQSVPEARAAKAETEAVEQAA